MEDLDLMNVGELFVDLIQFRAIADMQEEVIKKFLDFTISEYRGG